MKKHLLCILTALTIQMTSIPAICAEATEQVVSFESGSLVVTINKDFGTLNNPTDVTVTAYDPNGNLNLKDVIPIGTDGKLEFKYYNTGISGDYTFKFVIGSLGIKETATLTDFVGQDYWDGYTEEVNDIAKTGNVANIKDKILNEDKLNLNIDEYNNLSTDDDKDKVFSVMLIDYNAEVGFGSATEIKFDFEDSVSFVKYSKEKDAKAYYEAVAKRIGIPAGTKEDGISILDEVSKKAKDSVIIAMNEKLASCTGKKTAAELFIYETFYTVIKNAEHYSDVQYVMDAYIDAGLLNEDKNLPIEVYKELMNKSFSSEADLKTAVAKAKANLGANSQSPSSKPSSGGGGGGVAPSIPSADAQVEVQNKETSEINSAKMTFSDMEDVKWALKQVDTLFEKGIIAGVGDGKFAPHTYVTREQFAKMLCSFGGFGVAEYNIAFKDVDKNSWSYPYICAAYKNGIVSGVSDDEFAPYDMVTREQAVTMLYRMLSNKLGETTSSFAFDDDGNISQWAKTAVYTFHKYGIVNGRTSKTFCPTEPMTRVEAAALLYSAGEKAGWE